MSMTAWNNVLMIAVLGDKENSIHYNRRGDRFRSRSRKGTVRKK